MASGSCCLILLLLFALNACHSILADLSIDCGASGNYTETSVDWIGDNGVLEYGESIAVETNVTAMPRALATLRVFTTRRKNCYPIRAGKGMRHLLRASFYYGNYDNKASPPTFDLQFDGNHWSTVVTTLNTIVFAEAIYVAKGDIISVCVAQTNPNMFPFISALEVITLSLRMYSQVPKNFGLILSRRVAFGTKEIVKYPEDKYDRIWLPAINSGRFMEATSDAIIANTLYNDLPKQVLQNAFISPDTSTEIVLFTNLPSTKVPVFMNMYFSEVVELDSTQERSFEFYIDGQVASKPIVPIYGEALQRYLNISASSNTSFSLAATSSSTLPPLITALEVFTITDELTDGTSADDVEALYEIQKKFETLQEWRGDPCLPFPYTWDWINCSTDPTPRVTALYLSGYGLSGSLPDFSSMDALETIDLQNNSLNGPICDFLGKLPKLKTLNLANNDFSGPVPSSLSKNTNLKLTVTGNPDLCTSGKSCKTNPTTNTNTNTDTDTDTDSGSTSNDSPVGNKKKSSKLPVIVGSAAAGLVVFFVVLGTLAILHQRRKSAAVAAATTGQGMAYQGGTPQQRGGPIGLQVKSNGNGGPNLVNKFTVNVQNQPTMEAASNQMDHDHQAHQGDRDFRSNSSFSCSS